MNISFSLTTRQFRDRTKTVTRRVGWKRLKAGDTLTAVVKGMGLKKGEKVEVLGRIRIVSVRWEWLSKIREEKDGAAREGFPEMTADQFIAFFLKSHKDPNHVGENLPVTRIEFEYL